MAIELHGLFYQIPRNPAIAVGLPLALGMLNGRITKTSVETWFENRRQPPGQPPRWAFPVAWTYLYIGMGAASHLVVKAFDAAVPGSPLKLVADSALKLYWAQFVLNQAWTPLFFGLQKPLLALIDIGILTPLVYKLANEAYKVDTRTAFAFVPYCLWLTYASYLNAGFWWLNEGKAQVDKAKKKDL